jgi:hypothetical protein
MQKKQILIKSHFTENATVSWGVEMVKLPIPITFFDSDCCPLTKTIFRFFVLFNRHLADVLFRVKIYKMSLLKATRFSSKKMNTSIKISRIAAEKTFFSVHRKQPAKLFFPKIPSLSTLFLSVSATR